LPAIAGNQHYERETIKEERGCGPILGSNSTAMPESEEKASSYFRLLSASGVRKKKKGMWDGIRRENNTALTELSTKCQKEGSRSRAYALYRRIL